MSGEAVLTQPLRNAEPPLRLFVSSVLEGLREERRSVRAGAEALRMDPWVFEETPASSEGLTDSYLMYVADADFVIWLVGERTTDPVEREVRLAASSGRPRLLAFVLADRVRDARTQDLLDELGSSLKWCSATSATLEEAVTKTLQDELRRATRARADHLSASPPPPPAGFVEREEELHRVTCWASGATARPLIVAISGMPGVGKTALALELAARLQSDWSDASLFLDLRGVRVEPLTVPQGLARLLPALGFPSDHPQPDVAFASAMLRLRGVLVLDDARDEEQTREFLPLGSRSVVIVTGRAPLASLPDVWLLALGPLDRRAGVSMLARLADEDRVRGAVAEAERIVDLCGGLPLALRITGGRLATRPRWSLGEYAERLEDERTRLERLQLGDLDVRASFMLSYQLLEPGQADALHLAAMVSSGTLEADDVSAAAGRDVQVELEALADAQLLFPLAVGRYGMHELLRLFAREQWELSSTEGVRRDAFLRLARHFQRGAAAQVKTVEAGPAPAEAVAWLDLRRPLLRELVQMLEGRDESDEVLIDMALELGPLFVPLRAYEDWLLTASAGVVAARRLNDAAAEIKLALNVAIARQQLGDVEAAEDELLSAVAMARTTGDRVNEARALAQLGTIHKTRRRPEQALRYLEQALDRYRHSDDRLGEARALGDLGNVLDDLGQHAEATSHHEEAIACFQTLGDQFGEALEWANLGISQANLGEYADAVDSSVKADELFALLGARSYRAGNRQKWAEHALRAGDAAGAARLYELAAQEFLELGETAAEAELHREQGRVLTELGLFEDAVASLERAAAHFRELGDVGNEGLAVAGRASTLELLGDEEGTRSAFAQALSLLEEAGTEPAGHGAALFGLARVEFATGRPTVARPLLERAVDLLREPAPESAAEVCVVLSELLYALDEVDEGRVRAGQALMLVPGLPAAELEPAVRIDVASRVDLESAARVRWWARRALLSLPTVPQHARIEVGFPSDAPRDAITLTTQSGDMYINPGLLEEPGARAELRLGWHLHRLVLESHLRHRGIDPAVWIGSFLLHVGADWFALNSFADDDDEAPFGPLPPTDDSDVSGVGGTLGAAIAGSKVASVNLDRWLAVADPEAELPRLVHEWRAAGIAFADANELIEGLLTIWRELGGTTT